MKTALIVAATLACAATANAAADIALAF